MTKFAIFCTGILLCTALLTGCGSQQQTPALAENTHPAYHDPYQAGSTAPPAVRERPHLSSDLPEDYDEVTKN